MRANRGFLESFVKRFEVEIDDASISSRMLVTDIDPNPGDNDPAVQFQTLQSNLEKIYVPYGESIRIGRWIYSLTRGFVSYRYQSPNDYVDICMSYANQSSLAKVPALRNFSVDAVPIYAIDGLPGSGKSALFGALQRLFPLPCVLTTEGNPPQRVGSVSALWVKVNANFSLKSWVHETLAELGVDISNNKRGRSIDALTPVMFKALYRAGVGAIIVDELQFASGITSARRVLGLLLALRGFGVPVFFFANTDLLLTIEQAPAQVAQRIPRAKQTLLPLLREDTSFKKILAAQLKLVPFGHSIDIDSKVKEIYDMAAGLPRATARLIELAATASIAGKRPLTMLDLAKAKRSPSFDSLRHHISILTAIAPVDSKTHPELSSHQRHADPASDYTQQMREHRIQDAAALLLYASYSEAEREACMAIETQILRDSGQIPNNVTALGEGKRRRSPKPHADDVLRNSYAAKNLARFPARNPTDRSEQ